VVHDDNWIISTALGAALVVLGKNPMEEMDKGF
jgi:hypothetical protein